MLGTCHVKQPARCMIQRLLGCAHHQEEWIGLFVRKWRPIATTGAGTIESAALASRMNFTSRLGTHQLHEESMDA